MWRHVGRRWLPTTNKAWRSLPASILVAQHRLDGLVRGRADGMTSRWVRWIRTKRGYPPFGAAVRPSALISCDAQI